MVNFKRVKKVSRLTKKSLPSSKKVGLGVRRGLYAMGIPSTYSPSTKSKGRKGRVGRPKGPSGRYSIQGRPVGVFEYRNYLRRLRTKQRLKGNYQGITEQDIRDPSVDEAQYYEPRERVVNRPAPQQRPNVLQAQGNILNAPNIMRGELHNTGGGSDFLNVDRLNKPITNPGGDYFTDVDPLTGNQILRRRPRERWATGESK